MKSTRVRRVPAAAVSLAAPIPTESGDASSGASGQAEKQVTTTQAGAATPVAAPAPVVHIGGALDFGLSAPLPSSTWVNDWVAGSRQTAPNDWKLTI